jgi:hypothetical protein
MADLKLRPIVLVSMITESLLIPHYDSGYYCANSYLGQNDFHLI